MGKDSLKLSVFLTVAITLFIAGQGLSAREAIRGLTKIDAEQRAKIVSNVRYELSLSLDRVEKDFSGNVIIFFELNDNNAPLTIDFEGGSIITLNLNRQPFENFSYNNYFIAIAPQWLRKGTNVISVEYQHPYSKSGSGLYRFKDPEDENVYLYTDFEPYDANLLFPCFDQPDIKASYALKVEVPENWKVVTSNRESEINKIPLQRKQWIFPRSEVFSTYIFSLHAGPYRVWKSQAGNIPLRIFSRQSFAKYMNVNEWFLITKQGFDFFQNYFDTPYPFGKYDQLIVPDFNAGAMENTGAVTFNESYMPKGTPTYNQRERRANTILHEMAHMWFGNLVTMKWWDDLWLNESFATYMASLALAEATEFKLAWQTFYNRTKQWAYWEDRLVTTHPIVAEVPDTQQGFANFDGITYGKGASALKQLSHLLGPVNFREGVRHYFKNYAFKNTVMADFINSLSHASGKNLKVWTNSWLKTSNHNNLKAELTCIDNKITTFTLKQTAQPNYPRLREHKTLVGLYSLQDGKIVLNQSIPVIYSADETPVLQLHQKNCPLLIYPNHGDYDFINVQLDNATLQAAESYLSVIKDPFVRMMFWQSLWDMVRALEISIWDYISIMFEHLSNERDIKIATRTADRMKAALYFLPKCSPEDIAKRQAYIEMSESFLWSKLTAAKGKSDFQKLWLDTYTSMARSSEALTRLESLLNGNLKLKKYTLDQDRRWNIVIHLNKHRYPTAEALRLAELEKDGSEKGKKSSLAALVVQPDNGIKEEWIDKLLNLDSPLPMARARVVMTHLFPFEQETLHQQFTHDIFNNLLLLIEHKPDVFTSSYARYLTPTLCSDQSVKQIKQFIDEHPDLSSIVMKRLKVNHQEDERCVKIRMRALQ